MDEKMILIGGGVGPMAGVELHRKIVEHTATDGTDQDHLEVLHLSRSPIIGDRTDFLAGTQTIDPVEGMLRVFKMASAAFKEEGRSAVAGIPCNTFHAPPIFEPFREGLRAEGLQIEILHMLEETAAVLKNTLPRLQKAGLLSTTGTRNSGVYQEIFRKYGIGILSIPEAQQHELHEAIYHRTWGLKAVSPPDKKAVERVQLFCRRLAEEGAEAIILGCTELPLAVPEGTYNGIPYIDPVTALARALVR
ncbi:MAG: aspartate/glutamate racemase family protein, partial [Spirochaetaceae bacterium]